MLSPFQFRMLLLVGVICVVPVGCGDPPAIRSYVVASENQQDLTSELLRREFPPIPFRWEVPASWSVAANDQFSVRAWNAGPPAKQARITLGKFPARTGIPAQVMRWRGQLGLPTESEDAAMEDVTALSTQNGAGSFATIRGDTETILAFILPIHTEFWIFRFKGPNSTADREGDRFRQFCKSLEYVAPSAEQQTTRGLPHPSLPSASTPQPPASAAAKQAADAATSAAPSSTESTGDAAAPAGDSPGEEE